MSQPLYSRFIGRGNCFSRVIFALLLLATSGVTIAALDASPEQTAKQFLIAQAGALSDDVSVTVTAANNSLPTCHSPDAFLPSRYSKIAGHVTVGIRCANGQVRYLRANVIVNVAYWVTSSAIQPNTKISANLLEQRHGNLAKLPLKAITDINQAIGLATRHSLANNTILQSTQLRQPWLVHAQQKVTVIAKGSHFTVTRSGTALRNAALGDNVKIRMANRSIITCRVTAEGEVEIPL